MTVHYIGRIMNTIHCHDCGTDRATAIQIVDSHNQQFHENNALSEFRCCWSVGYAGDWPVIRCRNYFL